MSTTCPDRHSSIDGEDTVTKASPDRQVALSAAQPTGQLTIGNLFGAIQNWIPLQDHYDTLYCVVDLHALTVRQDPQQLRQRILELAAIYLAVGIDPERSVVFIQSQVHQHAELAWLLSTFAQLGELERMTQFKDKAQRHRLNVNAGLFTYPVLMAADILLYGTHVVPVGEDQKQHLELTRDIAIRFNNLYGPIFQVPEPMIQAQGAARVRDLQNPEKKMSKSAESELARVMILDDATTVLKKFKKAVTDSLGVIRFDEAGQAGVTNLLTLWCAATGNSREAALDHFSHHQYGKLKVETAEAVNAVLDPIRQRYRHFMEDPGELQRILDRGAGQAAIRAEKIMVRVMDALGLPVGLRGHRHG
ncbi:MAG: tryptophan--tRNA ligase [Magnetococcales bacterium]|nr:tryptophan--tRNA ligase [Magnetococcales bacterium]MBF0149575.1 tryptophan--tRNA ligase [Magnetococcales bacterium]